MKLNIEIPKNTYEVIKNHEDWYKSQVVLNNVEEAIVNGKPLPYGEWIDKQYLLGSASAECSYCHKGTIAEVYDNGFSLEYIFPKYCPKCGAKMGESE